MDKLIVLKNGKQELSALVAVTMMRLQSLIDDNPILFYELVSVCRNREHQFFGSSGEALRAMNLLETNSLPHESLRNVVLSAVVGDGLEMKLTLPVEN